MNFPPALYEFVTGELGLALVLILNKVDLAPPALVVAWKHYFHQHFPQLHVVLFTSFPRDSCASQDPGSGEWAARWWQGTGSGEQSLVGPQWWVRQWLCLALTGLHAFRYSVKEESPAGQRVDSGSGAGAAAASL